MKKILITIIIVLALSHLIRWELVGEVVDKSKEETLGGQVEPTSEPTVDPRERRRGRAR